MPTIIDSLLVTLDLDPTKFTRAQKVAAQSFISTKDSAVKSLRSIEDSGGKTVETLREMRAQALGLFAIFSGGRGIKDFVVDLTRSDTALGRTASFLGTTSKALSNMRGQAVLTGGSADSITGSIQGLNQAMLAMKYTGDTSLLPGLRALQMASPGSDLSFADQSGQPLNAMGMMGKLRGAFKGLSRETAQFVGSQLHLSQDLVYILTLPEKEYKRNQEFLEKYNQVSERDTESAMERTRAVGMLSIVFESLGRTVLTDTTPALLKFNDALISGIGWFQSHPDAKTDIVEMFTALSAALAASSFKPLLIGLVATAGYLAAIYGTVKLLQDAKKDMANGWKPGDAVPTGPGSFQQYSKEADERIQAMRYWRRIHGKSSAVDILFHGGGLNQKDEESFNRLYGAGSADQSELGMFGKPTSKPAGVRGNDKVKAFSDKFRGVAEEISKQTGVPVDRILAQAGLESGWNVNAPGNNLFGVKADASWSGDSSIQQTTEDYGAGPVKTTASFRKYGNAEDSFRDWAKVMGQDNFRRAREPGLTDAEYVKRLQEGHYATDGAYESKFLGSLNTLRSAQGSFGAPSSYVPSGDGPNVSTNNTTNHVSVTVHTNATDAHAIAKDIKPALERELMGGQAQYGYR